MKVKAQWRCGELQGCTTAISIADCWRRADAPVLSSTDYPSRMQRLCFIRGRKQKSARAASKVNSLKGPANTVCCVRMSGEGIRLMAIGVEEEGKGWLERTAMLKDGSGVEARDGRWGWGDVSLFEAGEGGGRAVLNGGHSKLIPSGSGPSAGRAGVPSGSRFTRVGEKEAGTWSSAECGSNLFSPFLFHRIQVCGPVQKKQKKTTHDSQV